jgi:hypothetical protein
MYLFIIGAPKDFLSNFFSHFLIFLCVHAANEQIDLIEAGIADLQKLTEVNGQPCIKIQPRTTETDYISVENFSGYML